jgi:predicted nucleotidyltransferase component of viral defense system
MIPQDFITEWRAHAPWTQDVQVEQDLVISRALIEIYRVPELAETLSFRGGTALYKLHLRPPARYSEDIDLVQVRPEPIGPTLDRLKAVLDPWLGVPRRDQKEGRVNLVCRMQAEGPSSLPMRLKVEINTREHFSAVGHILTTFVVDGRWFTGQADILTFPLDELLATKLRALYQRKKGRDLFDLWHALGSGHVDPARVVTIFGQYMDREGHSVSRAEFEENLVAKENDPIFRADIQPLLAPRMTWDFDAALMAVRTRLVEMMPGAPWKGRASR